jgi:hypothetical protein
MSRPATPAGQKKNEQPLTITSEERPCHGITPSADRKQARRKSKRGNSINAGRLHLNQKGHSFEY